MATYYWYGICQQVLTFNVLFTAGDEDDTEAKTEKSLMEKNDDLTAAFGSKKRQSAMSKRHKNRLTAGKLKDAVDTAVDTTLGSADVETLLGKIAVLM